MSWLDKHLVPDWREWWRMASIRLAAAFSFIVAGFTADPNLLLGIISFMPADTGDRALMAIGVGLTAFFGPSILRLWRQGDDQSEQG